MMGARQSAQVAGSALPRASWLEVLENTHMLMLHPCSG